MSGGGDVAVLTGETKIAGHKAQAGQVAANCRARKVQNYIAAPGKPGP